MFEAVIGIEIHAELKLDTKMFSGSPAAYGLSPNTALNEIDLAHPGALPSVNKKGVEYALKIARALNCDIETLLRFDRKSYYYSDLPKGYQITQEFFPLGKNGSIEFFVKEDTKTVRINRIHIEEDTAKQHHNENNTLIDFNRAGTALVEIVTEADFRKGEEAAAFVEAIRLLVIYLGVSDGKMSEGSLRCDVNISLRKTGTEAFGTKVEIKNLNSISNVEKAIEYEIIRQEEILRKGEAVISQTRRFDEKSQSTVLMRAKDGEVDYYYIADANIPPTRLPQAMLETPLEETPFNAYQRLVSEYKLSHYDTKVLLQHKDVLDYFDTLMGETSHTRLVVNTLTQDVLSVLDTFEGKPLNDIITTKNFVSYIEAIASKKISTRQAKEVFTEMLKGKSPEAIIKEKGMVVVSDEDTLQTWILEVIENNPRALEDHRKGLPSAIKFVTGQVMRISKGQANPQFTNKLVKELLDKAL